MIFKNDSWYNFLKWFCGVALPALGALYFALAQIWGFPYGEQVVGTLAALTAFGDALLGISSIQYHNKLKDGSLVGEDDSCGRVVEGEDNDN